MKRVFLAIVALVATEVGAFALTSQLPTNDRWVALGAIATAVYTLVFSATVVCLAWQIWELRRATNAQTFATFLFHNQNESARQIRAEFYALCRKREESEWSSEEAEKAEKLAEKVCASFDIAGIMCSQGHLDKETLVKNWRWSLKSAWVATLPFVLKRREQNPGRNPEDLYGGFQSLAEEAFRFEGLKLPLINNNPWPRDERPWEPAREVAKPEKTKDTEIEVPTRK